MNTTVSLTLNIIECANCGVAFGITEFYEKRRREDHQGFFCPSGHSNVYYGETEAEKLRKEVARLQTEKEHKDAHIRDLEKTSTRLRQTNKRICTRVKNGVCPCCNRTFTNLSRHMHTKHPDFKPATP